MCYSASFVVNGLLGWGLCVEISWGGDGEWNVNCLLRMEKDVLPGRLVVSRGKFTYVRTNAVSGLWIRYSDYPLL